MGAANSSVPTVENQGYGTETEAAAARRFVRAQPLAECKLRLLCLHGYGSNNGITQIQANHLGLAKKHGVECDFLCAQIEVGPNDRTIGMLSNGPFYSWFNWGGAVTAELFGRGSGAPGGSLQVSLCRVLDHIAAHGPYDGVYGFSQGALMATLLCSTTVWRGVGGLSECPFRFAILDEHGPTLTPRAYHTQWADTSA